MPSRLRPSPSAAPSPEAAHADALAVAAGEVQRKETRCDARDALRASAAKLLSTIVDQEAEGGSFLAKSLTEPERKAVAGKHRTRRHKP